MEFILKPTRKIRSPRSPGSMTRIGSPRRSVSPGNPGSHENPGRFRSFGSSFYIR